MAAPNYSPSGGFGSSVKQGNETWYWVNNGGGGMWSQKAATPAPNQSRAPAPAPAPRPTGGGAAPRPAAAGNPSQPAPSAPNPVDEAQRSQEDAARAAAEARRAAAQRNYEAKRGIAEGAKQSAKGQYDWLIETIGSNKKDALEQIALNESQGVQNYEQQDSKTREQYDSARKEILSTYRDLNKEQEKIMRGSGMQSSSRSQEAQLRLNNLMGKDLTGLTKQEADSLAMIGTALTQFKDKVLQTKNSVERETKGKVDKATLDFNDQIKAINANMQLSENEREDQYAAAEAQLAGDIANINTWASGVKLQQQQTLAALKGQVDGFITDMTDGNKLLNAGLDEKRAVTNKLLTEAGWTPLQQNDTSIKNNTAGVYQKARSYGSRDQLDEAYRNGELNLTQYQAELGKLTGGGGTGAVASLGTGNPVARAGNSILQGNLGKDPLLGALFA